MKKTTLLAISLFDNTLLFAQKAELYFGVGHTAMPKTSGTTTYSFTSKSFEIIGKDTFIVQSINKVKSVDSLKLKFDLSFHGGVYLTKNINQKFDLIYGLGFDYSKFNVIHKFGKVDFDRTEISRVKDNTIKIEEIPFKKFTLIGNTPVTKIGTDYTLINITIPLALRYNFFNSSLTFGTNFSIPIIARSYLETPKFILVQETATEVFYKLEKTSTTSNNPYNIARFNVNAFVSYNKWFSSHWGVGCTLEQKISNMWQKDSTPNIDNYIEFSPANYRVLPTNLRLQVNYKF